MANFKFEEGDKVRVRKTSPYYKSQGHHGVGTILTRSPDRENKVTFHDGYSNYYRDRDLVMANDEIKDRDWVEEWK